MELSLVSALSDRERRMTGHLAPSINPPIRAPARCHNPLAKILPHAISGTRRISASPDILLFTLLISAASGEKTMSTARGPSMMALLNSPLSPIWTSISASRVSGIFGLTFSIAASMATFGFSTPSLVIISIPFFNIPTFCSRFGRITIPPSVTINNLG